MASSSCVYDQRSLGRALLWDIDLHQAALAFATNLFVHVEALTLSLKEGATLFCGAEPSVFVVDRIVVRRRDNGTLNLVHDMADGLSLIG